MLPCGWLGGLLSGWLVGLLSDWLAGLLLAWLVRLLSDWLAGLLATATIDKEAERSTKTTVQLSNIDAGAGSVFVFNDKFNLSFAMRFARFQATIQLTSQATTQLTKQATTQLTNQTTTQPTNHKATST
jgi:hypothetical protein